MAANTKNKRRAEAQKNLQEIVEAYLREESSMRWGSTPAQIRSAAKQMVQSRRIPSVVVQRIRERMHAIREQSAGAVG